MKICIQNLGYKFSCMSEKPVLPVPTMRTFWQKFSSLSEELVFTQFTFNVFTECENIECKLIFQLKIMAYKSIHENLYQNLGYKFSCNTSEKPVLPIPTMRTFGKSSHRYRKNWFSLNFQCFHTE